MKTSPLSLIAFTLASSVSLSACSDSKDSTATTGGTEASAALSASGKKPSETAASSAAATSKPAESVTPPPATSGIVMEGTLEFGDSGATVTWTGEGVECAAAKCRDAEITIPGADLTTTVTGCCTADKRCGVDMAVLGRLLGLTNPECEVFAPAAKTDPACPQSEMIRAAALSFAGSGAVQLDGCCQANGQCGFSADFSFIGFGCVDPSRFGQKGGTSCTP